jgi:hypothetical protein
LRCQSSMSIKTSSSGTCYAGQWESHTLHVPGQREC